MTEALDALINGIFSVVILALGFLLNRKVNQVREQVKNDHPKNMREEQDERHEENRTLLNQVLGELAGIRKSVTKLWERDAEQDDRIRTIEQTQPRPNLTGTQKKRK